MITVVKSFPKEMSHQFTGALLRWLQGLGTGSFMSSSLGLVVTDKPLDSRAVSQLLHLYYVNSVSYTLYTLDESSLCVTAL